jgi:hypothetical protein
MDVHPKDSLEISCVTACPMTRLAGASRVLLAIGVAIATAGLMCLTVNADVPMSEYITVFFEQDGKPYNKPVRFQITCYGYRWDPGPSPPTKVPGSYQSESVYRIIGDCPHYGCKISHQIYLNYKHIDYCDLVAETETQRYTLPKFASEPVDMSTCNGIECSLRVDLGTPAVLPASPAASPLQIALSRTHEEAFLIALFFTLLIEVPILFVMVRFAFGQRTIGSLRLFITGVLASCLTLPCLWFITPAISGAAYAVIVGEILVLLVEAGVYILLLKISIRRALLVSFVSNLASLAFGLLLL